MKTPKTGPKAPLQFEPHIIEEFRTAVTAYRERLGRKMEALEAIKEDIQKGRETGLTYDEIAWRLSKGTVTVDSTTVARFCRDHLGEKKRKGKKSGGAGAASSPAPAVTTSVAATTATSKPEVEVP